jgi:hypothetical protein
MKLCWTKKAVATEMQLQPTKVGQTFVDENPPPKGRAPLRQRGSRASFALETLR